MVITLNRPAVDDVGAAVGALREWQDDTGPMQLHPGDIGWFWRFGAEATAAAVRTWSRNGELLALGLLDGPALLRMTIAPDAMRDEELAQRLRVDLTDPERGVLPGGRANLEAPEGALVKELLAADGWQLDEPWAPLRHDLAHGMDAVVNGLRIAVAGPDDAAAVAAVLRGAFANSTFTVERWQAMAAGAPFAEARSLLGYDDQDEPVATVTVWSAGRGRPGLLEPMGVHRDARGHGYGKAISVAAAAALRELGSSSAIVCTPSANVGGVATYEAAGFRRLPEVGDLFRAA